MQGQGGVFTRVHLSPLDKPRVVGVSQSALELIGITADDAKTDPDFAAYMSGNRDCALIFLVSF